VELAMERAKHVLVVDDDDDVRTIVVELLQGAGYEVSAASGGAAALRMMEGGAPALVLSDLVMREMDGKELLDRSRQLLGASTPPFVFVTGSPSKVRTAGDAVLGKPFDLEQLLEVIRHHC
jgi:CheY-like chemotaxis protein